MATFLMFGNYTPGALEGISAARTRKATRVIEKAGGKVKSMYALLGGHDLVLVVDLPDVERAVEASIGLYRLTGISFHTSPAVDVQTFDKLVAKGRKK